MSSPKLTKLEALAAVPVASGDVAVQLTGEGLVRLSYPVRLNPWLRRLLPRVAAAGTRRTVELDGMGSFVWSHIDGNRTVGGLADLVAGHYACLPVEAELAVAEFLRQLGRRGIIGMR
jgi:hypothetical protein